MQEYDDLFKFELMGDSGVGKTSLLQRFTENKFTDYFMVGGGEFGIRTLSIKDNSQQNLKNLML